MKESPSIEFSPIGYIRTPFKEKKGTPIQSCYSDVEGQIEIFPEYIEGLDDLEGFSHVQLIYHFHQSDRVKMKIIPFLDRKERGIFSTRAPLRPNPIGISVVELRSINRSTHTINIQGVDMIDYTPLLDIKPYVPFFDHREAKTGWISHSNHELQLKRVSDGRF